jgi:hypothetical protein
VGLPTATASKRHLVERQELQEEPITYARSKMDLQHRTTPAKKKRRKTITDEK